MSDTPNRLYMCHTTGGGQFYVVAPDETTARRAVEQVWGEWGHIERKGRVNKIDVLAEEGQYPQVPDYEVLGPSTWLLLRSTEPPNAEGVSEAMIERALHAPVPGGAEVWHWLPQTPLWSTGFTTAQPHQTAHNVMRAALEAALARPVAGNGGMSNTIDLAAIEKAATEQKPLAWMADDARLTADKHKAKLWENGFGLATVPLFPDQSATILALCERIRELEKLMPARPE